MATTNELYEQYTKLEREMKFNDHINPVDLSNVKPVTEDFPYMQKSFWLKLKYFIISLFVVWPFTWWQFKVVYRTKVVGKKNLKGVKSAIVTSNHITIFDCLVNKHALQRHRIRIVGANFNNKPGVFGEFMRVGGMLPLGNSFNTMKMFNNAIEHYLLHNRYVLIYPEESMWYMYDKPRPYRVGAFKYAVKFDVPVVPMFTTFRDSGKKNKDGTDRKYFTVNIGKPIYAKPELSAAENAEYLKEEAYKACVEIYEKTYNKKLEYAK